jgi:mRNA-degrading endonuclease HigB of HigAB toxin-antitoxin module
VSLLGKFRHALDFAMWPQADSEIDAYGRHIREAHNSKPADFEEACQRRGRSRFEMTTNSREFHLVIGNELRVELRLA